MITIIIPAYNAEKTISSCLNGILSQSVDISEYEVIVVDDGSLDNTAEVVKSFKTVQLIRQANQGPAAARNKGARYARGDIIIFTDSDCVPFNNWIEEMIRPFKKNSEVVGTKGAYRTRQSALAPRFVQIEYEDKYDLLSKTAYIDFIDTYAAAFKKVVFLEFGGYDTSFPVACAEDVELTFRMSSANYKMIFNPDAIVYHTHPKSFYEYFKKKYKFAYWRILAVKKNPYKLVKDSHTPQIMKFQILFFPSLALSLSLTVIFNSMLLLSVGILVLFFISTIPFSLKALKKDKVIGFITPFILAGRSLFQFFGVLNGSINAILTK